MAVSKMTILLIGNMVLFSVVRGARDPRLGRCFGSLELTDVCDYLSEVFSCGFEAFLERERPEVTLRIMKATQKAAAWIGLCWGEAAMRAATRAAAQAKFVENGLFVALGSDGKVKNYATGDAQLFVVFNEELNTIVPGHKYYATDLAEETPRAVAMYIGDTVTTDYVDKASTTAPKFAKISAAGVAATSIEAGDETVAVEGDKVST